MSQGWICKRSMIGSLTSPRFLGYSWRLLFSSVGWLALLLYVYSLFWWLKKKHCNVLLVASIQCTWPTCDLSHRVVNSSVQTDSAALQRPLASPSTFLLHRLQFSPREGRTYNCRTINPLGTNLKKQGTRSSGSNVRASYSLLGNSGGVYIPLRVSYGTEPPFPTEAHITMKILLVFLNSFSHSSLLPYSCLEGPLSKWTPIFNPLHKGKPN